MPQVQGYGSKGLRGCKNVRGRLGGSLHFSNGKTKLPDATGSGACNPKAEELRAESWCPPAQLPSPYWSGWMPPPPEATPPYFNPRQERAPDDPGKIEPGLTIPL